MEIGPYIRVEKYPIRGSVDTPRDWIETRTRYINGKPFDFVRTDWADGYVTLRVWLGGTTILIHEWEG